MDTFDKWLLTGIMLIVLPLSALISVFAVAAAYGAWVMWFPALAVVGP